MHSKNIRLIVRKQLKKQFPNWKRLPKKTKKELAEKVLAEVISEYDFKQAIMRSYRRIAHNRNTVLMRGVTINDGIIV